MRFVLFIFLLAAFSPLTAQRACNSDVYLQQLLSADPSLKTKMEAQKLFIRNRIKARELRSGAVGSGSIIPVIRIPVVIHVLFNSLADNLSDAQLISQIAVINQDFRKQNADVSTIPEMFAGAAADCLVEFYLATSDPQGRATSGIVRKKTGIQFFGLDDRIKKSSQGGDDPWDSEHYLNIWTGSLAGGVLGYSSPVGGPASTDGVVIRSTAFGTTGNVKAPFNKGRTATHEIGHWLGLQHIWGDQYCGDDQVDDTPFQQSATQGCPTGTLTSCDNQGTMYMNYMDLTNDACMHLFTTGQRQRIRALFEEGGARFKILRSQGLSAPVAAGPAQEETIIPIDIRIFPNPAASQMTIIDFTGNALQNRMFRIVNQFGQTVKQFRFTGTQVELNISAMASGVYVLETGDRKFTRTFIKS